MSNLGVVTQKDNQFVAKIATYDLGKRYQFAGPLRGDDEQLAYQDLCYIPPRLRARRVMCTRCDVPKMHPAAMLEKIIKATELLTMKMP